MNSAGSFKNYVDKKRVDHKLSVCVNFLKSVGRNSKKIHINVRGSKKVKILSTLFLNDHISCVHIFVFFFEGEVPNALFLDLNFYGLGDYV